ncbi:hypothetical protein AVEN_218933-1 [Araneus ventricosus]|uniref:Uncharacterized protein n=1 Tax=Araneus ventricosus TaxID=182803 RepID=A0A4Y2H3C9_ARAVE|nr:hypothetical protein AVEN_218933-1 [Araneus ventricosus]
MCSSLVSFYGIQKAILVPEGLSCRNIQDVREKNNRITICELPENCSISYGSAQPILTEYSGGKYQICAETSLYRLKRRPLVAALVLPECAENQENFLRMIATGDECL